MAGEGGERRRKGGKKKTERGTFLIGQFFLSFISALFSFSFSFFDLVVFGR